VKEAFHQNRARCGRKKGKRLLRSRGELLERPNAHLYETGAMRRLRLRGRANAQKRLVIHAAAANLGLVMRRKYGAGTPRGAAQQAAQFFVSMLATCWVQLLLALGFPTDTKPPGGPAPSSHSAATTLAAASSSTGC
jgi:hypothetical protein